MTVKENNKLVVIMLIVHNTKTLCVFQIQCFFILDLEVVVFILFKISCKAIHFPYQPI